MKCKRYEHSCGNVHRQPTGYVADAAARAILEFASPRAVTMDPEGRVWVENAAEAAECDLVGTYTRSLGILELTRSIAADLLHEKQLRGQPNKRRVVGRPRLARAA
jgi:hypothetical protein